MALVQCKIWRPSMEISSLWPQRIAQPHQLFPTQTQRLPTFRASSCSVRSPFQGLEACLSSSNSGSNSRSGSSKGHSPLRVQKVFASCSSRLFQTRGVSASSSRGDSWDLLYKARKARKELEEWEERYTCQSHTNKEIKMNDLDIWKDHLEARNRVTQDVNLCAHWIDDFQNMMAWSMHLEDGDELKDQLELGNAPVTEAFREFLMQHDFPLRHWKIANEIQWTGHQGYYELGDVTSDNVEELVMRDLKRIENMEHLED